MCVPRLLQLKALMARRISSDVAAALITPPVAGDDRNELFILR